MSANASSIFGCGRAMSIILSITERERVTCMKPSSTHNSLATQGWLGLSLAALLFFFLSISGATAQLSGTYTVGAGGTYATIDAALSSLTSSGVNGPVTFLIASGTYTPPSGGWRLPVVTGMSATNRVTFRPDVGATITMSGNTGSYNGSGIFTFDNGDYYTIDGSNTPGGTSKNITMIQTETYYNNAVVFKNGADYNVVQNCNLQGNSQYNTSSYGGGIVSFIRGGNDSNLVANCVIGDPAGVNRSSTGVYSYGSSTSQPNIGNRVTGSEIVNFGKSSGSYTIYGVYIGYYNNGFILDGNEIHQTSAPYYYFTYGIYVYEYYGYSKNTVIERNNIHHLLRGTQYTYGYVYALYYYGYYAQNTTFQFNNNMVSMTEDATTYSYMYVYTYYSQSSATIEYNHNSIYAGGTSTGYRTYMLYAYNYGGSVTFNHKNNIYYSPNRGYVYGMYAYYLTTGFHSDYNLVNLGGTSTVAAYYNFTTYSTFAAYQASGQDAASVTGTVPFVNTSTGDLHVTGGCDPFLGESRGTPLTNVALDIDGDMRSTFKPDVGADEGNFNGDGIRMVSPQLNEMATSDYALTVNYTTNRPLGVNIDLSIDGGANWVTMGTVDPTDPGANSFTIRTPYLETAQAKVRVVSTGNACEEATSGAFRIVHPVLTLAAPNGGELWVPTDTTKILWNSRYIPSGLKVNLEYSSDNGANWQVVAPNLVSDNLPSDNSYDLIVPNAPTKNARMRVIVAGRTEGDTSDAVFTVLPQPFVKVLTPNNGEEWFIGERDTIRWSSVTTEYVGIDYSTDGGSSWMSIASRLPAFLGELAWTIPNTPSESTLVRITDKTRIRFSDISDTYFKILKSDIEVIAPNGGEKFNITQPVTVSWTAENTTSIRLDYSVDNGANWKVIVDRMPAALGSYTFTPDAIPTRLALVRVSNADRPTVKDQSDMPFEIRADKSIIVYAPTTGDELTRGATTQILWDAPRVDQVNILYSSNGGINWQTVASGVSSVIGSYTWGVPNMNTTQGKIRIQEVGGVIVGESGIFRIVDPKQPTVTVVRPNGGESYTEGDPISILWSAADVQKVTLYYSTNSGANWNLIASGISAQLGQYDWTAPKNPGTNYRVRIASTNPSANDMSDDDFTVERRLVPSLTVLHPNGGEQLAADSSVTIRWDATDLLGNVIVAYSLDSGATWTDIATVPATGPTAGQYLWMVPNQSSSTAIVRVQSEDGSISDASDATFMITRRKVLPIVVVAPNGGEGWHAGEVHSIQWTAPDDVSEIAIDLSVDGGANWMSVQALRPSVGGVTNEYLWTIPVLPNNTFTALVRVRSVADAGRFDVSDQVFNLYNSASSVDNDAVAGIGMQSLGAYPNPFVDQTDIRWVQSVSGDATLRVFSSDGGVVGTYDLGYRNVGEQGYRFDGENLSSGGYIYELRIGAAVQRGVMMLVR